MALSTGCSPNALDAPPPTIDPAQAAESPPATATPAGMVHPLAGTAQAAVFDAVTDSLVVLGADTGDRSIVTVFSATSAAAAAQLDSARTAQLDSARTAQLDSPATAMTGGDDGRLFLSTKGGYFRFDIASGTATKIGVQGLDGVDITAIARRADGRLVLGSADGAVYTLASDTAVGARLKIFARVDSIVTQGNTAVVLDRGQTSVTSLNADGTKSEQALRAGQGATTMTADTAGRVLVADTRGGELLVYGVDPLILRQRFPVPDSPYGLAASGTRTGLVWVAQTAINTVVGYDLATGIPVEKVRYPTVQQPNSLAFDDASGTLYVVSGAGDGVQMIAAAGAQR